ncbi:ribbon-helix-helix domain-containing protein [Halovenus sp. HT40]|uniref:ribbon-helix-helix domain-containing protein n=1 Tax=Halovenus sp. HT40 TaxID=3126691 RepID=UPI00300F51D1
MSDTDTPIVRRKFTLPESLDDQLTEYAKKYYTGNRSEFLRCAIQDHIRTREGYDEFAIEKVQTTLEDLIERVDELEETTKENAAPQPLHTTPDARQPAATESSETLGDMDAQRTVHQCLLNAEPKGLTFSEVNDRLDADSMAIQAAIDELLSKEFIEQKNSEQPTKYQIDNRT